MEIYATTVYVIVDEVLRILNVNDDPQAKMSNSEVITFAIVTAKFYSGNYRFASYFSKRLGLFPDILSNSRLNRRIANIPRSCWEAILRFLSFLLLMRKTPAILLWIVFLFPIVKKNE